MSHSQTLKVLMRVGADGWGRFLTEASARMGSMRVARRRAARRTDFMVRHDTESTMES